MVAGNPLCDSIFLNPLLLRGWDISKEIWVGYICPTDGVVVNKQTNVAGESEVAEATKVIGGPVVTGEAEVAKGLGIILGMASCMQSGQVILADDEAAIGVLGGQRGVIGGDKGVTGRSVSDEPLPNANTKRK